jgi:ACS family tartrate transporter-like MFS transporter
LSQWFPAKVRARSISRFYISLPLSSVVMGGLAGALLNLQGRFGLAGWQWLFLVEGLPAVILSAIFFFYLPNTPAEANWLTTEERGWLQNQLLADNSAAGGEHSGGVLRAILNPRVWQLGLFFLFLYIGYYAYTFSAPLIIQQVTGFSNTNVGYVIALFGGLGALSMALNGLHSDLANERYLHLIVPCVLLAAAYFAAGISVQAFIVIPAFAIIMVAFNATGGVAWAIPSSYLTGKSAAAGIATANTIAIIGGFIGPYWMGLEKDFTGNYQRGLLTLSIPSIAAAAILLFMRRQAARTDG